jgi:hypothetical protein
MRAQCVLVATTPLHGGAKFDSFLYTGSKTVRVNMESCYDDMSTRLKQRIFPITLLKISLFQSMISVFRRDVDEISRLLGYYAASNGNPLPIFRDKV